VLTAGESRGRRWPAGRVAPHGAAILAALVGRSAPGAAAASAGSGGGDRIAGRAEGASAAP